MTLKVAIVGSGKIADGHVDEIQKLPHLARVVATCDIELLMAEQLARRFGVAKYYDDFEKLLEAERPDVVHITTPPGPHLALAKRAMEAGCHVYVEKPLTPTHEQSVELIDAARSLKRQLTVGYTYLFDPPALEMRQLIAEGVLGDPVHVETVFGYNLEGAFGAALLGSEDHWVHRLPGKLFQNNVDHMFNKLVEFIPDDAPRIHAHAYVGREGRFGDIRDEMEDELRVMVLGERVTAYGTFSSHARPAAHYCKVFGTKNTLLVDYVMRTVTVDATPKLPSAIGRLLPAFDQAFQFARQGGKNLRRFKDSEFHFFAGLNELIRRYYESILSGGEPPISYRDILRISSMMDQSWKQLEAARKERRSQATAAGQADLFPPENGGRGLENTEGGAS